MFEILSSFAFAEEEDFSDVKIRIVRPRYFTKRFKLEFSALGAVLTNDPYMYSFLAIGDINFHFNEWLGLEISGGYGTSIKKAATENLDNTFFINITDQLEVTYLSSASILITPMYGKYQISSGRLVYFDTYLSLGGGITGVTYRYEHCNTKRSAEIKNYPTVNFGVGQRYLLIEEVVLIGIYAIIYLEIIFMTQLVLPKQQKTHLGYLMYFYN